MNRTREPLVSVVTLTYNRKQHVLELMEWLHEQDYPNLEIVVVDNASPDGTADALEQRYPKVRVIRSPQNLGYPAYTFGVANARGEYLFIIDDDGLPADTELISRMVDKFEANQRLAVAACVIRMRDTGRVAYDSPQCLPTGDPDHGYPCAAYNGTGAGLRASAVKALGFFPRHSFVTQTITWIELHLCARLLDAGWEVRCFPDLEVWHSRPSGSVDHPMTFHGIREYLWFVWSLYPVSAVVRETLRFVGSQAKAVAAGRLPAGILLRGIGSALIGWRHVAPERRPIQWSTLAYLERARRQSDRAILVPPQRPFQPLSDVMRETS